MVFMIETKIGRCIKELEKDYDRMTKEVQIKDKLCLTIEEAAKYTNIGENLIRDIVRSNRMADFILWKGSHALLKREKFEEYILGLNSI